MQVLLVVWTVAARDFPEQECTSRVAVPAMSSRPPSRPCQRAGSLASSASSAPRFRRSHSALVTGNPWVFNITDALRASSLVSTHATCRVDTHHHYHASQVSNETDATARQCQLTGSLARRLLFASHARRASLCVVAATHIKAASSGIKPYVHCTTVSTGI
jgi:hypothetical protein